MKVPINLATQPFRRDRPVIVATVAMSVALTGLLGLLIMLALADRAQLADSRAELARLQKEVTAVSAEQATQEAVLRKPENAEVLERGIFLNNLLYRKCISWMKIFADLEKTLPFNVRVISVRPSVNGQNQVTLDMVVGSESPEAFIGWLQSLQDSPLFSAVNYRNSVPPSQTNPLYQFRVSATYAQKL